MQSDMIEPKEADVADALKFIFEESWPAIGDEFFRLLVRHLAIALGVRYVYITECTDSTRTRVRTLASWMGEDFGENIEYDLSGTPCENVMKGNISYYPKDVQALFPRDEYFITLGVQGYLGIPFFDSSNRVIGHMGILDTKPMNNDIREMPILKTFAARAGIELERKQAQEELKKYRDHLEELVDQRTRMLKTTNEQLQQEITNRKQTENLLIKSDKHYRTLFEDSPISIWVEDFSEVKKYIEQLKQRGIKDFQEYFEQKPEAVGTCAEKVKVLDVNKASLDLFEAKDKQELLGGIQLTFTEESYTAFLKEIVALAKGDHVFECEATVRSLKGEKRNVAVKLTIPPESRKCWSHVLVSLTDITERKQAEEKIVQQATILEATTDFVAYGDLNRRVHYVNRAGRKMVGLDEAGDLPRSNINDYHPDWVNKQLEKEIFPQCVREGSWEGELALIAHDGHEIPVSAVITSHRNSNGEVYLLSTIMRDITDRKQAEKTIKEFNEKLEQKIEDRTKELKLFKNLINQSNDAIFVIDPATGRFLNVNNKVLENLGDSRKELLKMKAKDIGVTIYDDQSWKKLVKKIRINDAKFIEGKQRRKDGSVFPVEINSKIIKEADGEYLVVVARDITERKRIEEDQREFSLALSNAMPGISRVDPDGRYLTVNDVYAQMLGYEPSELISNPWEPMVHLEDRKGAIVAYEQMKREGKGEFEARAICKDGSQFFKQVLMVKRLDKDGNFIGHHCFMKDITERKQAEEALKSSKLSLEQKNIALNEIITQVEIEKNKIKENIMFNVDQLIIPNLKKLRRKGTPLDRQSIGLLEKNLEQLTSAFGENISQKYLKLTPREIEICNMIRNGLSSKEIAGLLYINYRSVELHRTHIRKKLGISHKDINLTSYLQSF